MEIINIYTIMCHDKFILSIQLFIDVLSVSCYTLAMKAMETV